MTVLPSNEEYRNIAQGSRAVLALRRPVVKVNVDFQLLMRLPYSRPRKNSLPKLENRVLADCWRLPSKRVPMDYCRSFTTKNIAFVRT